VECVGRALGFSTGVKQETPEARPGEVVIYYGGWTLQDLATCPSAPHRVSYPVTLAGMQKKQIGYYRLICPLPGSDGKDWYEQRALVSALGPGWSPVPVSIAATALLVHFLNTGEDLLSGGITRCAECADTWTDELSFQVHCRKAGGGFHETTIFVDDRLVHDRAESLVMVACCLA
jgi:hypothetical protein